MKIIGIDLGGTKLAGAVFSDNGKIIERKVVPIEKRKGKDVGLLIKQMIENFLVSETDIKAVGVSVPGITYSKTGKVWAPNISGWDNYPLLEDIKSVFNKGKVIIESDRSCYIMGEVWKGSAKGCKDAIFIAVGTGIGAGILVDGNILRGSNDIAGAIGWLALERPYDKKYIQCGCFEYNASGEGLSKVAHELIKSKKNYSGLLKNKKNLTAKDVFDAYEKNDLIAKKVINNAIELWGMSVANLVSIFNPEKIIFGGGVFGPAQKFLTNIMTEAKKWSQPISITQVKLETSSLGSDAGLYGAGYSALQSILKT